MTEPPPDVERAARHFLRDVAGFAQVTTLDRDGFPVARTMTAFPAEDWTVSLVQRNSHIRLDQWRRDARTLVSWVGSPAPAASNESPHVFDLGLLPPRAVFIRGRASVMDPDWTVRCYQQHLDEQRTAGHSRAPVRDRQRVRDELAGVLIRPVRIRLEGFGIGAASFDWTIEEEGVR